LFLGSATLAEAKKTPHPADPPAPRLHVNQVLHLGRFDMQISELEDPSGDAATGKGSVFIPCLNESIAVEFEQISVSAPGDLTSGKVRAVASGLAAPDYLSPEADVINYLRQADMKGKLPLRLNRELEALGMQFGGHNLVMTQLEFTKDGATYDAVFMVDNPDGRVTTFSGHDMPFDGDKMAFCNLMFPIDGPDQPVSDPEFPITIKKYDPTTGTGTYATFSCNGFNDFHVKGEYRFSPDVIKPSQPTNTDPTIASFEINTISWRKFMATVTFNGPFEIAGVDDVVITVSNASIDYDDTQNPVSTALTGYLDTLKPTKFATAAMWRGIYIKELSVQLPASLSIGSGGGRISFSAKDVIFDKAHGLTATFIASGVPNLASGNLEGWGLSVKDASIQVTYSSPRKFEINGGVLIPLVKESIPYKGTFSFPPKGATGPAAKLACSFKLDLTNKAFTLPLLKDANITFTGDSKAGFQYAGSKFTPFANLNGSVNLDFGSDADIDFKLPGLGFQSLTLNYDATTATVVAEPAGSPATGGLKSLAAKAFSFGSMVFNTSDPAPAASGTSSTPAPASTAPEPSTTKVKGFPLSIKNIKLGTDGDYKKLDFTISINFTEPKVGLVASAGLTVKGKLDAAKLNPMASPFEPWKALSFHSIEMNSISIEAHLGGVDLIGGVVVIKKDPTYGDGFKGFLKMTVEPGIVVDVVGQFGTISGAGGYRYFFADALMTSPAGVPLVPLPIAVYGFGGGIYYNMTQTPPPAVGAVSSTSGAHASTDPLSSDLLKPGVGLACTYTPVKGTIGVKATLVLGTIPPNACNMDLTLGLEFNTDPFGLRKVTFQGNAYFMASLADRQNAKVKGTTTITYDLTNKTLTIGGSVSINVSAGDTKVLDGGGSFAMFFNLRDQNDWYIAIGAPPIKDRMQLNFYMGDKRSFEGYFVTGNLDKLPAAQRQLPAMGEYDPLLAGMTRAPMDFGSMKNGRAYLMGARFAYKMDKWFGIFNLNAGLTVGFDAMMSQMKCEGYNPTGIGGWYLQANVYAALSASLRIHVNLFFHKGNYNIASISAAASLDAKLPNPTWIRGRVEGRYRILGGLVKGSFHVTFEVGDKPKCTSLENDLDLDDVLARIKVIGDVLPAIGSSDIKAMPVYREKLVVTSFLKNINEIMDFSAESDDGLMVKPVINYISLVDPVNQTVQGSWKYLNGPSYNAGINGVFDRLEFVSTKLLQPKTDYRFTLQVKWLKKTKDTNGWVDAKRDDGTVFLESVTRTFTTGTRPTVLPPEAVLASYPENPTMSYFIPENPAGGGLALKMDGWGYLFNPKKRATEGVITPCDPNIVEYNYVLRITEKYTGKQVFEAPLTAVPTPETGCVGDPQYVTGPCKTGNWFVDYLLNLMNIKCKTIVNGPCCVQQPSAGNIKSNVRLMPNTWNFGGSANNFDLLVTSMANVANKAIGFPDFSSALKSGGQYTLTLVGEPIRDESYNVGTTTTTDTTITASSGQTYQVQQASQTLQGSFTPSSADKILYQYDFGASRYNSFVEKLGNTSVQYLMDIPFIIITPFHEQFFNGRDFDFSLSTFSNKGFPIKTVQDMLDFFVLKIIYVDGLPGNQNKCVWPYYILRNDEGINVFETKRLAMHTRYDRESGLVKHLSDIGANVRDKPSVPEELLNSNLIPAVSPYFVLTDDSGYFGGFVFNPGVGAVLQKLNIYHIVAKLLESIKSKKEVSDFYNLYAQLLLIKSNDVFPDPNYGNLFTLKYTKKGETANLFMNGSGKPSGSFTDFGGTFYIRSKGSGKTLADATSSVNTTNTANKTLFVVARNSDGTYSITNKDSKSPLTAQSGGLVKDGTPADGFTLTPQEGGTFRIEKAGALWYEKFDLNTQNADNGKVVASVAGSTMNQSTDPDDYAVFYLDPQFVALPEPNISGDYLIRVQATGRYLGLDGNFASVKNQTNDNTLHFILKRMGDGTYELWNKDKSKRIFDNNGYLVVGDPTIPDNACFQLVKISGSSRYYLKCKGTGNYLTQQFDWTFADAYKIGLIPQPTKDGYSEFTLETTYQTPPEDLSGVYYIKANETGYHLSLGAARKITCLPATLDNDSIRFVLKQMAGGTYEMWNKANKQRMMLGNLNSTTTFSTDTSSTLAQDFLYLFFRQAGGDYQIRHRTATSEFVVQNTTSNLLGFSNATGQSFNLETTFQPLHAFDQDYYVRMRGSEKYWQMNADPLAVSYADNGNASKFRIERQKNGAYKFKSAASGYYLYLTGTGGFSTTAAANTPSINYDFNLIETQPDTFRIQSRANNRYLFENFDPGAGAQHEQIRTTARPDTAGAGYADFSFGAWKTPESTLSGGDYFIKTVDTYHHLSLDNTLKCIGTTATVDDLKLHFMLKKITGGKYEIWSKAKLARVQYTTIMTGQKTIQVQEPIYGKNDPLHLHPTGYKTVTKTVPVYTGIFKPTATNTPPYSYLFELNRQEVGYYKIKYAMPGNSGSPMLGENTQNSLDLTQNGQLFNFETAFLPAHDYAQNYYLRVKGSAKYLNLSSNVLKASYTDFATNGKFKAERQTNGAFRLKLLATGKYLYLNTDGVFTANPDANIPAINYEFKLDETSANNYRIQSRANNLYLLEYFDPTLGAQHEQIRTANLTDPSDDGYSEFSMETAFQAPTPKLSGQFLFRIPASGRYFGVNGNQLSTLNQPDDATVRFTLKWLSNGSYELWNAGLSKKVYVSNGVFAGDPPAGLAPANSHFLLNKLSNNNYAVQCEADKSLLTENFNWAFTDLQRIITRSGTLNDGYAEVSLETTYQTPPENISGAYFIRVNSTGRHVKIAPNQQVVCETAQADEPALHFKLKMVAGGKYEIWNAAANQRFQWSGAGFISINSGTATAKDYWFELARQGLGGFKIKSVLRDSFLLENAQKNLTAGKSNEIFSLEEGFRPAAMNNVYLRVVGSKRYLTVQSGLLAGSYTDDTDKARFSLERLPNGAFKIKSTGTGSYLYRAYNGFLTSQAQNIPANAYEFYLVETDPNVFRIVHGASGNYLFEQFDPSLATQTAKIDAGNFPQPTEDGYSEFTIETKFDKPAILAGQYLIRNAITGRNVGLDIASLSVKYQADNDDLRFSLKPMADGSYELWNKKMRKRVFFDNGLVVGDPPQGASKEKSRFLLTKLPNNNYSVRLKESNLLLTELFNLADPAKPLLGLTLQATDDRYTEFTLESGYKPPVQSLSGRYTIRVKATGRYWGTEGSGLSTRSQDFNDAQFALKLLPDDTYEIWNMQKQQKVIAVDNTNLMLVGQSAGVPQNANKFTFARQTNGAYQIISKLNQGVFTNWNPPSGIQRITMIPKATTDGYSEFTLETSFNSVLPDLSGIYKLRLDYKTLVKFGTSQNNTSFLKLNAGKVTCVQSAPDQFYLKQVDMGQYEIWHVTSNQRILWDKGGFYKVGTSSNPFDYQFDFIKQFIPSSSYKVRNMGQGQFLARNLNSNLGVNALGDIILPE
jgi:hypothetical protein